LASIKELVQDAGGRSLHEHLAAEREHFVRNLHHPNGGIGIAAFLGKHPARYE
ncbi:MAG: enoyl-CoA hydratase, partial [Proteobacteria bacterium]|nr:enoyl-CoA hydratase [Pseudomonadota bacterium]